MMSSTGATAGLTSSGTQVMSFTCQNPSEKSQNLLEPLQVMLEEQLSRG